MDKRCAENQHMHQLPHSYVVSAASAAESNVTLSSDGLESVMSAPPEAFGGPGNLWSPETLLVADCFILSFRAIARASKFAWSELQCSVDGTLDKVDGELRFSAFTAHARLTIASDADAAKGEKLLHKAERSCLITNSMFAETHLTVVILISD
jgi:organic hydroperoxide reductase OsmC/OhrA